MFDFNLDDVQENINLKEGINKGLKATKMFEFSNGSFGPQLAFEFSAGKLSVKYWLSISQEPKLENFKDTKDGTAEENFEKAKISYEKNKGWKNTAQNTTISQFISGFYSPKEDVKSKMRKALSSVDTKDVSAVAEALKGLLPADWESRKVDLVLHYPKSTAKWLSIPDYATKNNGRVFNAHEDRTLEISSYFKKNCMGLKGDVEPTDSDESSTESGSSSYNW